jgi:ATP adenylyltransferase
VEPLWTPWRMPYIQAIKSCNRCVFCEEVLVEGADPDLVIHRGRHAFVVMNLYPYTTGHLMIVPYRHAASLSGLDEAELEEATILLQRAERAVEAAFGTRRHHVGINLGRCAGAGVEGHIHIHLVPRVSRPADDLPATLETEGILPLIEARDLLAAAWSRTTDHSTAS